LATASSETPLERRVWKLLIEDFYWDPPEELGIKVRRRDDSSSGPVRLQIFEVAVTATLAQLRPDYEWSVTPNLAGDGGVDFVGQQQFLTHEAYGIAAAITVGGQCKKHQGDPGTVHHDIAGALMDMADTLKPTFFVVAFSAHVSETRIDKARHRIESTLQRHCHIFDRTQVERLLSDHLSVLDRILAASELSEHDVRDVHDYFAALTDAPPEETVSIEIPEDARAGESFNVGISVKSAAATTTRLRWRPAIGDNGKVEPVDLIGPVGATTDDGAVLTSISPTDDPFLLQRSLEFRTHSIGDIDLGEVRMGPHPTDEDSEDWKALGKLRIVENMRPRFFEAPFRPQLRFLAEEHMRATEGTVVSVGVLGAGGSGKSRVCDEFSLEKRRGGSTVVTAKQAKSNTDPHLMLSELYLGLIGSVSYENASDAVLEEIARYDTGLAKRAEPSIRSIFAAGVQRSGSVSEEGILATLLLLTMARARQGSLIVHLQDLHWSSADVLGLLGDLTWQLDKALADSPKPTAGVFFIFEGRHREKEGSAEDGWDSRPFEAFLQKLDCRTTTCKSLDREEGREFIVRLFEARHTARRLISSDLLELQEDLIEQIDRTAGGNPFHSLEQVRLLREVGVIARNPETGFLYLVRPQSPDFPLPNEVFASIRERWQYMKQRTPELALLTWALALLEDRTPTPLFRRLWRDLAPEVSLAELDATDMIWTGEAQGREISFRHENYFRALRRFEVVATDRERAVDIYCKWFEEMKDPDPANKFRWGRMLLERSKPETARARRLLKSAERGARQQGDLRLARRILIVSLNLGWEEDERSRSRASTFLRLCDGELRLIRDLLGHDRPQAGDRIADLQGRIEARLSSGRIRSASAPDLQRRLITAEVRKSQYLFNAYRPARAAEVAAGAIRDIEVLQPDAAESSFEWRMLEMEALHSRAVGLALSGELEDALETSERAVAIAEQASDSALAGHVVCTHAAILLATDPGTAESLLRDYVAGLDGSSASAMVKDEGELNLSESLILQAYANQVQANGEKPPAMLTEARSLLQPLFTRCFQLGQYPDAGAAALLLGTISAVEHKGDEVSWFAQAVAAASRGGHMETLWRSHIDLATALHCNGESIGAGVRDHALAAAEIMEETLSYYTQPDASGRFEVLRFPLAQAARFLLLAGDERGDALLTRYPKLRECFESIRRRTLLQENGDRRHYQWLWVGDAGYMLY
jgi:hypothetical protein